MNLYKRVYTATTRQLRRIESTNRSPIYNHFFETMNGVSTIRAYSQQQRFIEDNFSKVDENQVAYYPTIISFRWGPHVKLSLKPGFQVRAQAKSISAVKTPTTQVQAQAQTPAELFFLLFSLVLMHMELWSWNKAIVHSFMRSWFCFCFSASSITLCS